jgi:transposase
MWKCVHSLNYGHSFAVTQGDQSRNEEAEAVKRPGRLTRRPIEMKRWIVEQTLAPGASVAIVARRHGVNANQVFEWRKKYREGRLVPGQRQAHAIAGSPELIRIGVIDQAGAVQPLSTAAAPPRSKEPAVIENDGVAATAQVEIHLPNGIKVRADAGVDSAALRRVLAAARDLA